jgi:hypothetical protein
MESRANSAVTAFNASSTAPDLSKSLLNPPCNRTGIGNNPVNGTDLSYNSTSMGGEQGLQSSASQTNMAILISLIVLIVLLLLILSYLIGPPIIWFVKRRIPVDPKKLDARYETIEGWLISKVRHSCDPLVKVVLSNRPSDV